MTNRATISITDTFTGFSRRLSRHPQSLLDGGGGGRAGLHFSASKPLWALSVRDRLEYGSGAPFRGQYDADDLYRLYPLGGCAPPLSILLACQIGNATQAEGWELQANCFLGDRRHQPLWRGRLGAWSLLGSFILTTINNGANLLNVNAFWQRIITGVLIIVIVYFDGLRAKKR